MSKTFFNLPHGLEVLIIKASVDPEFKALLLDHRAQAAGEIGLILTPVESAMLAAIPREQLETIIDQTEVPAENRRVFLGKVAAAMLVALGVMTVAGLTNPKLGSRPDRVQKIKRMKEAQLKDIEQASATTSTLTQAGSATNPEAERKPSPIPAPNLSVMKAEEFEKEFSDINASFGFGIRPGRDR